LIDAETEEQRALAMYATQVPIGTIMDVSYSASPHNRVTALSDWKHFGAKSSTVLQWLRHL
jgi:hypothetical protein